MVELRAYALGVAELQGLSGLPAEHADEVWALAQQAFPGRRLRARELVGPIYRRVPGGPVLRDEDPTPADLETLLAGDPVPADRAAATWRLVEAVVAGLAWSTVRVLDADLPDDLLAPLPLVLPGTDDRSGGWCPLERAAVVAGLHDWLIGAPGWAAAAARTGRPTPDLLAFLQG